MQPYGWEVSETVSEFDPPDEVVGDVDFGEVDGLGGVQVEAPAWTVIVPPMTEAWAEVEVR